LFKKKNTILDEVMQILFLFFVWCRGGGLVLSEYIQSYCVVFICTCFIV